MFIVKTGTMRVLDERQDRWRGCRGLYISHMPNTAGYWHRM